MNYLYNRVLSFWEKKAPYIGGAVGITFAYFLTIPTLPPLFLSGLATVGAIMAGLSGTSLSILLLYKAPIMDKIQAAGYFVYLMKWVRNAALLSLILAIIALGGIFYENQPIQLYYKYLLMACTGGSVASFFRIFCLIPKIGISKPNETNTSNIGNLNENQ